MGTLARLARNASHQKAIARLGSIALTGMPAELLTLEAARVVKQAMGADVAGVVPDGDAETHPPPFEAEGMISVIVAPIGPADDLYGLLGAGSRSAAAFSDDDLPFLQSVANVLGEVAARERAAGEALRREAQLNEAQRLARMGSWEADLVTGENMLSDNLRDMLGLDATIVDFDAVLACVHEDDRGDLIAKMNGAIVSGQMEDIEFRILSPTGAVRLVRAQAAGDRNARGRTTKLRGTVQDVTDEREAELALRRSEERFRKGFDLSPVGMTLIEPLSGRYLQVNAAYCRFVGRSAEELLTMTYRDVVHPDDFGQPERMAFGGGSSDELASDGRYIRPDGTVVLGSINASRVLGPDGSVDVLFSQVEDVTDRRAREATMRVELEEAAWVQEIHAALAEDRLELHAQPIVHLATGEVVQQELLLRMRSSAGELIAPGEFLPAAERYGVIREIDRWVIGRGAELAAEGRNVEINISGTSMSDAGLIDHIDRELERTGAEPSRLVFEITETAVIGKVDTARRLAEHLRARGCRFALDDFGTGFGGLSSLKTLPLDFLKIDREFVGDLLVSETDRQVIAATINLARAFGLQTIAEGVEDVETLDVLRELGVDHAQGYYLGRPAPIEP